VQNAGLLMGKKRQILLDVSSLLPGYNGIVQTSAMGIMWECRSLPIRDMMDYIRYTIMTLTSALTKT